MLGNLYCESVPGQKSLAAGHTVRPLASVHFKNSFAVTQSNDALESKSLIHLEGDRMTRILILRVVESAAGKNVLLMAATRKPKSAPKQSNGKDHYA